MLVSTSSRLRLPKLSSLLILLFLPLSLRAGGDPTKLISDELVKNLSCLAITPTSILHAIDATESFSQLRHIPKANWSFSTGLYTLANCWSLTHAQRMFYYLGRTNLPETLDHQIIASNMVREAIPENVMGQVQYNKKKVFAVIPWTPNFFQSLETGFTQNVNGVNLNRSFTKDTQAYQTYRFHQILQNAEYISAPRERPPEKNAETYMQLITNLQFNRLTEVLIRPALRAQHVVLAKKYIVRPTGETDFFVYDSNFPARENVFTYDPKIRHFTALEIVQPLGVKDPEKPVGVFVVDEEDRDAMMKPLVAYYEKMCE